jgi:hypothetical protein
MATSKDKTSGSAAAKADDPFDFAPGWRPEPMDTVTGEVTAVDMAENQYGPYPVVTVKHDNSGELVAIHGFHTVLRNAFERIRPMPGARIAVRYLGEVTEDKSGRKLSQSYYGYQVRALDQSADDVWGRRTPDTPTSQFNDDPPF